MKNPFLASFHGLWSLAGFAGAAVGTFMIGRGIDPSIHFSVIAVLVVVSVLLAFRFLKDDTGSVQSGPVFVMPDSSLMKLGIIAFCSLICEGAMFDWSVIYFKKVIHAENAWMAAGYTAFMATMATGRFVADSFSHKFGLKKTLQLSGSLTAAGLLIAVIFPYLVPAVCGFLLVGFGVSSVVPLVYSAAGKSKTMQPRRGTCCGFYHWFCRIFNRSACNRFRGWFVHAACFFYADCFDGRKCGGFIFAIKIVRIPHLKKNILACSLPKEPNGGE